MRASSGGSCSPSSGRDCLQRQRRRPLSARGLAMIVRCIDNTLQRDVLVVGRESEVYAQRDDCYVLSSFDNRSGETPAAYKTLPANPPFHVPYLCSANR